MELTDKIKEVIENRGVSKQAIYKQLGISPRTLERRLYSGKFDEHHEKLFNMLWGGMFNE
jgi:hypothetical protein